MNAAALCCVYFAWALEALAGCSRGGGGRSRGGFRAGQRGCSPGLCWPAPLSALHTSQTSTSVTHLSLSVHRPHRFLRKATQAHLFCATFVSLFPVTVSSGTHTMLSPVSSLISLTETIYSASNRIEKNMHRGNLKLTSPPFTVPAASLVYFCFSTPCSCVISIPCIIL